MMSIIMGARWEQLRSHSKGGVTGVTGQRYIAAAPFFGTIQPADRFEGMVWVDSSFGSAPWMLKRWDGSIWEEIGVVTHILLSGLPPIQVNNTTPLAPIVRVDVMSPAGPWHARGVCADPGSSSGTTRFWREDATWSTP